MPTQEQINAAQVELDIANDNYARMADKYNKYNTIFEAYAKASPEKQEAAKELMQSALAEYNQLKLDMLAAEDRVAVAQNAVNNIGETMAMQQAAATQQGGQKRRTVTPKQNIVLDGGMSSVNESTTPGRISTVNGPTYVGGNYSQPLNGGMSVLPNASSNATIRRDLAAPMSTVNGAHIGYITNINQKGYGSGGVAPVEIQTVHNAKGSDYLKGLRDLEKKGYTIFNQKAYKNGKSYDLRSWKKL